MREGGREGGSVCVCEQVLLGRRQKSSRGHSQAVSSQTSESKQRPTLVPTRSSVRTPSVPTTGVSSNTKASHSTPIHCRPALVPTHSHVVCHALRTCHSGLPKHHATPQPHTHILLSTSSVPATAACPNNTQLHTNTITCRSARLQYPPKGPAQTSRNSTATHSHLAQHVFSTRHSGLPKHHATPQPHTHVSFSTSSVPATGAFQNRVSLFRSPLRVAVTFASSRATRACRLGSSTRSTKARSVLATLLRSSADRRCARP